VPAGPAVASPDQTNFGCAEFVSRALAAEGLLPGLNAYSPRTGAGSFEQYNGYNLLNVGTDVTMGLYQYLINSGIGQDIGFNPTAAAPGDVVFWYNASPATDAGRYHAALLVQTGALSDTLFDGHNNARHNEPLAAHTSPGIQTIVHIRGYYLQAQVTVQESNTTSCPGTSEYFTANDLNGVPVNWTYANGSHPCIRVSYAPRSTSQDCIFDFFVPTGYATANIIFSYTTADGATHSASLNEAPLDGWYYVFDAANVTHIEFRDNNGQAYPTEIGWGSDYLHGFTQTCVN
jgi:hypothetical protein